MIAVLVLAALAAPPPVCTTERPAPIPHVSLAMQSADFWLAPLGPKADAVVLTAPAISRMNEALVRVGARPVDLDRPPRACAGRCPDGALDIGAAARDRYDRFAASFTSGELVSTPDGAITDAGRIVGTLVPDMAVRIAFAEGDLRCLPTLAGFWKRPIDTDFDRNRCTGVHPGERVQVFGRADDGWLYVSTGHAWGWLKPDILGPPLAPDAIARYRSDAPFVSILEDRPPHRLGVRLPLQSDDRGGTVWLPTPRGPEAAPLPLPVRTHVGPLPFTRRNLFELAFTQLGAPYGWGDRAGLRDCSRLILDLFVAFGLDVGRNSLLQSQHGSRVIELAGLGEAARRRVIEDAGRDHVVLLYMPGHVMLYLGSVNGQPYAMSALSEFAAICDDGREQVMRTDRVAVTDLELGRGTSRTAFIERITRLVLFGPGTGVQVPGPSSPIGVD